MSEKTKFCKCGREMTDLTHGLGYDGSNYICRNGCGQWHFYKGRWWNNQQWGTHVNDIE